MASAHDLLGPMRLPFVILAPVCVLLGIGTALRAAGRVDPWQVALVVIGAIAAHLSVNTFNEYGDFRSGLDARTQRTPFSGGSGVLPERPGAAQLTLITALATLVVTVVIGAYFALVRGPALLPLVALGILVIVAYTPWLTRHPLLCLIAPGMGFGPLMVMGTHVALTGEYAWSAGVASLVPFFLVSDLLLLNQFPDVEADRSVGRRHLSIVLGRTRSGWIYIAFLWATYAAILGGVGWGVLPPLCLLGLTTIVLAIPVTVGVVRHAEDTPKLVASLALNVIINLATPVLVAVGLFFG